MKILLCCALFVWVGLLAGLAQAVSVTQVMGGAVNAQVDGICLQTAGGFNMKAAGVFTLPDPNDGPVSVGAAPFDNPSGPFFYTVISDSVLQNTQMYRVFAPSMTQVGSQTNINIANSPDRFGIGAHQYNSVIKQFVWSGRQTTGVCVGTPCLHLRAYMSTGPSTDAQLTTIPLVVDDVVIAQPTYDENFSYFIYRLAAGYTLGKFDSGSFSLAASTLANNVNTYFGIAVDNSFVYAQFQSLAVITRFDKSNIGAGPTGFAPGMGAHVRYVGPTYDSNGGFLYTVGQSAGLSPNVIYKIRVSDMTVVNQLNMGNTQFPVSRIFVDNINSKLYYVWSTGGFGAGITRINRTTFLVEASYNPPDGANSLTDSAFDPNFQAIYTATAGPNGFVAKTQLCGPP